MKNKLLSLLIGLGFLFIFTTSFAEARHHHGCRSTSFGINIGQGYVSQPCYDSYVVQRYRPVVPAYRAPVYVPEPACEQRVVLVQPRPVIYQEQVLVIPRQPVYNYYSSFGFGWNWCR